MDALSLKLIGLHQRASFMASFSGALDQIMPKGEQHKDDANAKEN